MGRYSLRTIHQEFNLIQLKSYLYVNSLIKLKMFTANLPTGRSITPALIVVDMQNGFVAIFFFKQKTAYEIGLGIPAEPLFRSVKDWFRYESHFVHGRDSLVDILKERGLLSESDAVQPLIGKKS